VFLRSVLQLLVTANFVSSSLIISTLMMKAIRSSETSVLTRAIQHHIPEDGILYGDHLPAYFLWTLKQVNNVAMRPHKCHAVGGIGWYH
jgi:hypothetical protein